MLQSYEKTVNSKITFLPNYRMATQYYSKVGQIKKTKRQYCLNNFLQIQQTWNNLGNARSKKTNVKQFIAA